MPPHLAAFRGSDLPHEASFSTHLIENLRALALLAQCENHGANRRGARMSAILPSDSFEPRSRRALRSLLRISWLLVRVPAYLLLAMLEPLVSLGLTALALLSLFTAILFRLAHVPHFPFGLMLGFSLACALALALYHAFLAILGHSPVRG